MREGPRESLAQPLRAWKVCRKIRGIPASPRSGRCGVLGVGEGCAKERTSCNNAFASFCAAEGTVPNCPPRFNATWPTGRYPMVNRRIFFRTVTWTSRGPPTSEVLLARPSRGPPAPSCWSRARAQSKSSADRQARSRALTPTPRDEPLQPVGGGGMQIAEGAVGPKVLNNISFWRPPGPLPHLRENRTLTESQQKGLLTIQRDGYVGRA